MANLWTRDDEKNWAIVPLDGTYYALSTNTARPVRAIANADIGEDEVLLGRHVRDGGPENWVLKSSRAGAVRVNGRPLYLGLCVLRDRDEIFLGNAARLYFSTEKLARVEPLPESIHGSRCGRCHKELVKATPAVQCPQCGAWCHQTEVSPCWTYTPVCPLCDQATAMDAGYRWTPEEL